MQPDSPNSNFILVPSHSPLIFPTYLLLSSTPTPSSSPSSSSFLSSNSYPNLPHSSSLLKTHSSPHLSHFFFFSSSSPFPLLYPLHLLPPFPFFVMYYFVLKFLFHCSLYCIEVWCFFFHGSFVWKKEIFIKLLLFFWFISNPYFIKNTSLFS